jgi:DnaJ-class molecular chaperone
VSLEIMLEDAITGQRRRLALSDGRNLDVAIPPGVESGQTLRLKSQGAPGTNGGAPGDALVELTVKPSDRYRREGDDVHAGLKISLTEAVEGGKVPCPTPTGEVALNVPAGSNSGTVLRLRGRGVQREAKPGDLYVTLQVCLPEGDEALRAFVKGWARRGWVPPER